MELNCLVNQTTNVCIQGDERKIYLLTAGPTYPGGPRAPGAPIVPWLPALPSFPGGPWGPEGP